MAIKQEVTWEQPDHYITEAKSRENATLLFRSNRGAIVVRQSMTHNRPCSVFAYLALGYRQRAAMTSDGPMDQRIPLRLMIVR